MSDAILLDTDVASYLFKNSARAKPFRPLLKGKQPALAFVSVAELYKWTLKRHWGPAKVAQLETALR
jgi:tRNA(fMet)-specific endonuclease VapC